MHVLKSRLVVVNYSLRVSNLRVVIIPQSLMVHVVDATGKVRCELFKVSHFAHSFDITCAQVVDHGLGYVARVNVVVIGVLLEVQFLDGKNVVEELCFLYANPAEVKRVIKIAHDGDKRVIFRGFVQKACIEREEFSKFESSLHVFIKLCFSARFFKANIR